MRHCIAKKLNNPTALARLVVRMYCLRLTALYDLFIFFAIAQICVAQSVQNIISGSL